MKFARDCWVAAGRLRDGTPCSGLQPHPRHEHHGHPTAHGSDQSELTRKARAPFEGRFRHAPRPFLHGQDPKATLAFDVFLYRRLDRYDAIS